MLKTHKKQSPLPLSLVNAVVIVASLILCALALPLRLPGMDLAGIGPHWLLAWVVAWSVKRDAVQGTLGGIAAGLIQDSLTAPHPTHALGLALVGFMVGRIKQQRLMAEEFVSIALIVLCMAGFVEVILALQFTVFRASPLTEVWSSLPQTALSSAILSSLWTPVVYYPLNLWWNRTQAIRKSN
ncbi:MAG: rod shape-determining protein MreD [Thermosynechococcaceae cyanobacterium]